MADEWFQWLQPNGILLIGVFGAEDCDTAPEMYDMDGQCATGIPFTFMNHKFSMTLFTKAGWNALLIEAGFELIHTETDIFKPPPSTVYDDEPHYLHTERKRSIHKKDSLAESREGKETRRGTFFYSVMMKLLCASENSLTYLRFAWSWTFIRSKRLPALMAYRISLTLPLSLSLFSRKARRLFIISKPNFAQGSP